MMMSSYFGLAVACPDYFAHRDADKVGNRQDGTETPSCKMEAVIISSGAENKSGVKDTRK